MDIFGEIDLANHNQYIQSCYNINNKYLKILNKVYIILTHNK